VAATSGPRTFSPETPDAVQLREGSGRLAETIDKDFRFLQIKVR
jgi:hypothetical protein